ncbi:MAG TPA: NAD(P)-dependent alcohol dehydrogenase [Amycolatopsis sp.]|uniref:NAD(P)-dependent alcohol dehydrogenase n=1 Tax=Amycolatopsis sp. TaxID=37632 RepID=UPI002B46230E|nr:NAD(P)-dependent alcohol dehydrogenase [Amycolatopsis sp.]HKS45952.1 NAD(P)-dependent alcohol dehydrogenase [Amycolatopsis sp.]
MHTTTAAVVETPGAPFAVTEVVLDEPRENEVLVRMVAAGLCHTDLGVQAGGIPFKLPGILGHEGAGIVEQTGSGVTKVQPGDKVLLSFTSCGHCTGCRDGHPAYCDTWLPSNLINGTRNNGTPTVQRDGVPIGGHFFGQSSFAELALADERSVVKVDPGADLATLAPLGCSVQTGFGAVWNILAPKPGASLAVFGTGAVGLASIIAANLLPLGDIIAVDRVPARLEMARQLGARHTVNTAEVDLATALAEITGGRGIDNAVDTTGVPAVLRAAVDALATRGACAVVGAPPPGTEVSLDIQGLLTGKRVLGVTLGDGEPETLLPQLVSLHRQGKLPLDLMIRHYKLEDLNDAAHDMHTGTTIKPVVLF